MSLIPSSSHIKYGISTVAGLTCWAVNELYACSVYSLHLEKFNHFMFYCLSTIQVRRNLPMVQIQRAHPPAPGTHQVT